MTDGCQDHKDYKPGCFPCEQARDAIYWRERGRLQAEAEAQARYARGVADERARVAAWLRMPEWWSPARADAIERGEHEEAT